MDPITGPTYEQKMADFQKDYDNLIQKSGHITPVPVQDQPNPVPSPQDFLKSVQKSNDNIEQWSQDPSYYGKPFSAPTQDFERYSQSSEFKKLGYDPYSDNENLYHENQSTLNRLTNAGSQLIGKTIGYTVQTAGFLLGAPAAVLSNDMTKMTDNFLVKASDVIKDFTQDHNPIYKGDQYTKGTIWDKLASTDWWMDDAVDRIALTASMFVPGVLEAKGIGLAGMGVNALKTIASNPESYGTIAKTFLPKLYEAATIGSADISNAALKSYANSLTRAELYGWNIVGQSALNAKETQEGIRKTLQDERAKGNNSLTDEQINLKAANGAKAAFWETVPVTLAASLWEIPQMFSTTQGAKSILDKLYNSTTGEALLNNLKSSAPHIGKIALTAGLTGFEHGQNESMQVAISRYNEDSQAGKDTRGTIPGIWGDFLDNVNDPNGQNNIALGTIQGILMTLGGKGVDRISGKYQDELQQKQKTLDIINGSRLLRRLYNGDFTQKDPNGPIIDSNGNPVKDQDKITTAGLSLAGVQQALDLKKAAIEQGNYLLSHKIDHDMLAGFSYDFLSDPSGLNHLQGILSVEKEANKNNPDFKAFDEHGNPLTPDQLYNNHVNTIKTLKKIYDGIEQRHAGFTDLDIDPKDPLQVQQARPFLEAQRFAQYHEASNQLFFDNQLNKNKANLSSLAVKTKQGDNLDSKGNPVYTPIKKPSTPDEEQYNQTLSEKEPLEQSLEISKTRYKKLIDKNQIKQAFKEHVEFLKPIIETAKQKQDEAIKTSPVTEPAPTTTEPVTPAQIKPNEPTDPLKDPVIRQRLQEALVIADKEREQAGEPLFHTIENFAEKSPIARDIIAGAKPIQAAPMVTPTTEVKSQAIPIELDSSFRTQSFGRWEGTKEKEHEPDIVDLIKNPENRSIRPGYTTREANDGNGDSLTEFSTRVLNGINKVFQKDPDQTAVVTSSSVIKLLLSSQESGFKEVNWDKFIDLHTKNGEVYPIEKNGKVIFLVRHGETEDNKAENLRTPETPLTPKGEKDIVKAYKWFTDPESRPKPIRGELDYRNKGPVTPPKIVSSDFLRTRQTAQGLIDLFSKENKPILPEFKGKIVFLTAGTGKTQLSKLYPDQVIDGDQLLFEFLQEKNIPSSDAQKSGLDFYKYITKHPKEKSDLIAEFQNKALNSVKDGKTLLTASKYLRAISSPVYLSQDVGRIAKVFEERGQTDAAKTAAKHIKKNKEEFEGAPIRAIPEGIFAEHILTGTKPEVKTIEVPESVQKIAAKITDLKTLDQFKQDLIRDVTNDKLSSEVAEKIYNDRRKQLTQEVNFDTINKEDILIMKDKRLFGPKGYAEVISKGDNYLKVRKWYPGLKGATEAFVVPSDQVKTMIDLVYKDGMKDEDITPVIDQMTEQVAKLNQADMLDDTLLDGIEDLAKDKSADELEDNLGKKEDC